MAKYIQDCPNTIKIELTKGCNLKCDFCSIHIIQKSPGKYKFMSIKTAKKLAKDIKESEWTSKIEFTMRGEPLANPNTVDIINIFRNECPKTQLMVTTNGLMLLRKPGVFIRIDELFDAGLNILAVDCYEVAKKAWSKIKEYEYEDVLVVWYPGSYSPNIRYPVKHRKIILIDDIGASNSGRVGSRKLSNHTGTASPPLTTSLEKRCARPFRELAIFYDGKVPICCNDWRGKYKCGDSIKNSICSIWQGEEFNSARKILYSKNRNFDPCIGCDNVSFRVGILPDKLGKKNMGKPTKKDFNIAKEASKGKDYTVTISRRWNDKD